jgi:hypothetical protein
MWHPQSREASGRALKEWENNTIFGHISMLHQSKLSQLLKAALWLKPL